MPARAIKPHNSFPPEEEAKAAPVSPPSQNAGNGDGAPEPAPATEAAPSESTSTGGGGPPGPPPGRAAPSKQSRRGLDWFVFCVADIQTGFGPFVAVFLTSQKWTQTDIGIVLTIGGLVGLFGQIPAGAFVDTLRSQRRAAMIAVTTIGLCAFLMAAWPLFPVVVATRVLHAVASSVLGITLVSLSLSLVGRGGLGERLGRNVAFASAGTGLAAAGMGATGYYISNQAVFFLTAALVVPAIIALYQIRPQELIVRTKKPTGPKRGGLRTIVAGVFILLTNRSLLTFALCLILFHLANAAMLPLAASMLTLRSSQAATIMVAAAIVVPQFTVVFISPLVGRKAQTWGRRPLLLIGFGALLLRGVLFTLTGNPFLLVAVQVLEGVSSAVLGVLVPLVIADVTRQSGHFNLAQGTMGCAMGIGAAFSTTAAGYFADHYGSHFAFVAMAVTAGLALATAALVMPETRPQDSDDDD